MREKNARVGIWRTLFGATGFGFLALAGLAGSGSATARQAATDHSAALPGESTFERVTLERCNPSQVAEDFWFSGVDPEAVTMWFDTVSEAENYADPEGRSVYWLVRVARTLKSDSFVSGINDLWAVEFYVTRRQCELVVTGEH